MIERYHDLALRHRAEVRRLSRAGLHYLPCPVSQENSAIIRRSDELRLDYPFAASGMLHDNVVAIRIDGRGSWWDNGFVERHWRTVEYRQSYPHT